MKLISCIVARYNINWLSKFYSGFQAIFVYILLRNFWYNKSPVVWINWLLQTKGYIESVFFRIKRPLKVKVSRKWLLAESGILLWNEDNEAVRAKSDNCEENYYAHKCARYCFVALISLICKRHLFSVEVYLLELGAKLFSAPPPFLSLLHLFLKKRTRLMPLRKYIEFVDSFFSL